MANYKKGWATLIDLTGERFGRWKVICRSKLGYKRGTTWWLCLCDCGTIRDVASLELRKGRSKSCGCYQRELQRARLLEEMRKNGDKYGLKPKSHAASYMVEKDGERHTLTVWSKKLGIPLAVLINRWRRGWRGPEILRPTLTQLKEQYKIPDPQFDINKKPGQKETPPEGGASSP